LPSRRADATRAAQGIELTEAIEERCARCVAKFLGDERLDGDVAQLAAKPDRSRENESLARDIQSAEIDARVRFRISKLDRATHRD
jgi:hypothetical protein